MGATTPLLLLSPPGLVGLRRTHVHTLHHLPHPTPRERPPWLHEYLEGTNYELYVTNLPPAMEGMAFSEASQVSTAPSLPLSVGRGGARCLAVCPPHTLDCTPKDDGGDSQRPQYSHTQAVLFAYAHTNGRVLLLGLKEAAEQVPYHTLS